MANHLFSVLLTLFALGAMFLVGVSMEWLPLPDVLQYSATGQPGSDSMKQHYKNTATGITVGTIVIALLFGYFA